MTFRLSTYGPNFWRQAAERAVKTAAQAALLTVPADMANVLHNGLGVVLSALAGGVIVSVLTSVATAPVGPKDDPSAVAVTTP
jgi:Putative lactococcus lactis phage r1t holin